MLSRRKGLKAAQIMLAASVALGAQPGAAWAQSAANPAADPAELDPNAPMDAMPDIGVAWPDMAKPDAVVPVAPTATPGEAPAATTATSFEDGAAARRYRVSLSGINAVDDRLALQKAFEAQSALAERRKDSANAAQIDRRARADADLLEELLRAQGYYDADAEPRIEVAADAIAVVIEAVPGPRYKFAGVELPGLNAAGSDEVGKLRDAFAVKVGDPVVAEKVIAAGIALTVALGEHGFATADIGEQDIVIDHQAQEARLVLPITPGPVAHFGVISVTGSPPFSARHVGVIARFKAGDRYQRSNVDDLRRALVQTGLVASAEVKPVPVDGGKTIDLAVHLEPAPFHTIAGELGYGTGEGVRAEASWQHRN